MIKIALILAIIGHILCGVCDVLLTYTPKGKVGVKEAKDPVKMAELFEGASPTNSLLSMVLGTLAITLLCSCFRLRQPSFLQKEILRER